MKWTIPAKTFLLGEYAALAHESAIIATTAPCFELSLSSNKSLASMHIDSPAGRFWMDEHLEQGLSWYDPYQGCGGLGASSAEFLGVYLALCHFHQKIPDLQILLDKYAQFTALGEGIAPSGYDLIAQTQSGCVFINRKKKIIQSYAWPFKELSFFLIHTGKKLSTHEHLQKTQPNLPIDSLSAIVDEAKLAFEQEQGEFFVKCINSYHRELVNLKLVVEHSLELMAKLAEYSEILAMKGCGAMGADLILIVSSKKQASSLRDKLLANYCVIATENQIISRQKSIFSF